MTEREVTQQCLGEHEFEYREYQFRVVVYWRGGGFHSEGEPVYKVRATAVRNWVDQGTMFSSVVMRPVETKGSFGEWVRGQDTVPTEVRDVIREAVLNVQADVDTELGACADDSEGALEAMGSVEFWTTQGNQ